MRTLPRRICLHTAILLLLSASYGNAQTSRKPLTNREVMALVAGEAVSEDIAVEVDARGLAFHPNDPYRSLLATAGGDAVVLEALTKAKILDGSGQNEAGRSNEYLGHLALAGKLTRAKQYQEAAAELDAAIQADNSPEAGFVMGGLLSSQERWREAAVVYAELLHQDPNLWERALKVTEAAHGAHSSNMVEPLQGLGKLAMIQKDYKTAADFFTRAAKVNEENYGEVSDKYAESMIMLTMVYGTQGAFDQAEPVALRAVHIEESLHGKEDEKVITPLSFLCNVYDGSNQTDKAEACDERLIPIMESKFGKDNARLGLPLKSQAQALRRLGRADEAEKVEQRIQAIQTGAGQPAGNPSAQIPAN